MRHSFSVAAALWLLCGALPARADESGASAWLPGQFASFAAVPGDPGFSLETIYYRRSASAEPSTSARGSPRARTSSSSTSF